MRVLVTGGGTGGHIYPALAVVRTLQQVDDQLEVLYIGTEKGLENEIVTHEGLPFKHIEIAGFKRSLSLENFKTIMKFFKSVSVSKKYIKGIIKEKQNLIILLDLNKVLLEKEEELVFERVE